MLQINNRGMLKKDAKIIVIRIHARNKLKNKKKKEYMQRGGRMMGEVTKQ